MNKRSIKGISRGLLKIIQEPLIPRVLVLLFMIVLAISLSNLPRNADIVILYHLDDGEYDPITVKLNVMKLPFLFKGQIPSYVSFM